MTKHMRPQGDLILCLHNVVDGHGPLGVNRGLDLTAGELEAVLSCLLEEGYRPAALDDIRLQHRPQPGGGERRVAITFDDGYAGNLHVAYPLLRRHDIPFTVYVTTGFMDREVHVWWYALERLIARVEGLRFEHLGGAHRYTTISLAQKVHAYQRIRGLLLCVQPDTAESILQQLFAGTAGDMAQLGAGDVLSAEQVRAMSEDPLVTIGAHSMSHPALRQLDEEASRREIHGSGERLAAVTGKPARHFAYPFGNRAAYGPREERLVRESGYQTAVTTCARQLQSTDRSTALPRIMLTAQLDVLTGLRALLTGWLGSRD
jgi:peptidoglycan/xylan/chitin deacetylase (PgdA/CDA1 family)